MTERPAFWEVYRDVRPDKEESERHPTVTEGPSGEEKPLAQYFRCARECGELLTRARAEFLARKRADLLGESPTPAEDVDGLWEEIHAKQAEGRQAVRDEIGRARTEMGDARCREALTDILTADGLAYSEATACVDRLEEFALHPHDSDLDLIGDAFTGLLLRAAGQAEEAAHAFDAAQQAEEDAVTDDALTLLLARFLQETGRGLDSLKDPQVLREWGLWLAARWDIPPVVAEQTLAGLGA
jgi:hypothetical protein